MGPRDGAAVQPSPDATRAGRAAGGVQRAARAVRGSLGGSGHVRTGAERAQCVRPVGAGIPAGAADRRRRARGAGHPVESRADHAAVQLAGGEVSNGAGPGVAPPGWERPRRRPRAPVPGNPVGGRGAEAAPLPPPPTAQELEPGPGSSLFDSRRRSVSNPSGIGDGGDGTAGAGAGWEEITLVAVFVSDRKSFEEAAGRGRISPAAWDEVRKIVKDANRKFWGWRVDVGGSLAALKGSGEGRPSDPEIARDGLGGGVDVEEVLALTADFQAQEAEGQAWLLAFEDAQDALRFCLSCCIELTYSPWEGFQAWRGGSSATTPDGAALWNGPPVGFTVHSVTRGGASSGDAGAGPELWCSRSLKGREETIRGDVGAGLLEALVAAQLPPSNARVVLTGPAWASLNEGLGGQPAHFGKAVCEHLGRVHVPCLSRPLEAYHVLPVQLAARTGSFVSLRDAAPECLTLLSPGARDAPRPTAHLTFMFTAWFAPSAS